MSKIVFFFFFYQICVVCSKVKFITNITLLEFTYFIFITIDVFITTNTKFTTKHKHFIKIHIGPVTEPKCVPCIQGRLDQLNNYASHYPRKVTAKKTKSKKKKKGYKLLFKSYCPNPIVPSLFGIYLLIIQKIPHKLCSQHFQRATIIVRHTS